VRRLLLLSALCATGLAGCGESGNDLIPERTAARMIGFVDEVESAMAQDPPACTAAREAAQSGSRRVDTLSSRVDEELKANLKDWFEHLEDEARKACRERDKPEKTPTPDKTEEPTPTATPTPTETPAATPTAAPTEAPTETPPEEPTPQPPPEEEEDFGSGAEPE
jgi:outer membrane biosynthesis protein TonB